MKKAFVLLCLVAALLAFPVYTTEYTHGVYEITFSAAILSNDSVGNDWEISYHCDDNTIISGKQQTVLLNDTVTKAIEITVTEKDKIPDMGSGSITVTLSGESETKTTITVTENGGSYQGNEARWEITCKVKLIELK